MGSFTKLIAHSIKETSDPTHNIVAYNFVKTFCLGVTENLKNSDTQDEENRDETTDNQDESKDVTVDTVADCVTPLLIRNFFFLFFFFFYIRFNAPCFFDDLKDMILV